MGLRSLLKLGRGRTKFFRRGIVVVDVVDVMMLAELIDIVVVVFHRSFLSFATDN